MTIRNINLENHAVFGDLNLNFYNKSGELLNRICLLGLEGLELKPLVDILQNLGNSNYFFNTTGSIQYETDLKFTYSEDNQIISKIIPNKDYESSLNSTNEAINYLFENNLFKTPLVAIHNMNELDELSKFKSNQMIFISNSLSGALEKFQIEEIFIFKKMNDGYIRLLDDNSKKFIIDLNTNK